MHGSSIYGVLIERRLYNMSNFLRKFWEDEDGIGVVEMILILVVLIGLVLIFKNQLSSLVNGIFSKIQSQTSKVY